VTGRLAEVPVHAAVSLPSRQPVILHTACVPLEVHLGALDKVLEAKRARRALDLEFRRAHAELALAASPVT
jgi:hypothetical protein